MCVWDALHLFGRQARNVYQSKGTWHWVLKGEEQFSSPSSLPTATRQEIYPLGSHQIHLSRFPQSAHDVGAHSHGLVWVDTSN